MHLFALIADIVSFFLGWELEITFHGGPTNRPEYPYVYGKADTYTDGYEGYATASTDGGAYSKYGDARGYADSYSWSNWGKTDTDSKVATDTYYGIADMYAKAKAYSRKPRPPPAPKHYIRPHHYSAYRPYGPWGRK